jgi:2-keto-4-pentenoate hydratase/2-oxohepta-3-ene-1,7-dioic acid hydratase in catechol pathway
MKLCNVNQDGRPVAGLIQDGNVVLLQPVYSAYLQKQGIERFEEISQAVLPNNLKEIIKGGEVSQEAINKVSTYAKETPFIYDLDNVKLMAPIVRPGKIFGPGINNRETYEKADKPPGEPRPLYCTKLPTCVVGPYDSIKIPDIGVVGSEVEIATVIGKTGKFIPKEDAHEYIYGHMVANDITAHTMRGSEWIVVNRPNLEPARIQFQGRYKNYDTFMPTGPCLTTKDEVGDIHDHLAMKAILNDELVQEGTSGDYLFNIEDLISYISFAHVLEPGDIVLSGTVPAAPGWVMSKIDLRHYGGTLQSEIQKLGALKNPIEAI